jgi:hypothetical protein
MVIEPNDRRPTAASVAAKLRSVVGMILPLSEGSAVEL